MKIRSTVVTAIAVLGFAGGIATVHAAQNDGFMSRNVSFADLNLDSDAGAKVFYTRVRSAAKLVCATYDERDVAVSSHYQDCFDKAVSSAVAQVNNGKVTALYTHSKSSSMKLVASR